MMLRQVLKAKEAVERYGATAIPCELGGEYELSDNDTWVTARYIYRSMIIIIINNTADTANEFKTLSKYIYYNRLYE